MPIPRRTLTTLAALAFAASVAPAADAAAAGRFEGKALGNSPSGGLVPKHTFPVGAAYTLQFRDAVQAGTRYRLCARMHGRPKGCKSGRTGAAGKRHRLFSGDIFNPQSTGKLTWRWHVGGKVVARWTVHVTIGD
jgi:hypothetical protein